MKFENTFEVEAPIDEVYATLLDVERVAPCVPGAEVIEKSGDDAYTIAIKVRVGPISMTYRGNVEIVERDDANHRAVMRARARETRGQGTADARVDLSLVQDGPTTKGTMAADVQLAGRAAAMGRGVIQDVSAKIVSTFSSNLEAMLRGQGAAAEEPAARRRGPPTPRRPPTLPPPRPRRAATPRTPRRRPPAPRRAAAPRPRPRPRRRRPGPPPRRPRPRTPPTPPTPPRAPARPRPRTRRCRSGRSSARCCSGVSRTPRCSARSALLVAFLAAVKLRRNR